ncbi:Transmembrane GTPase Marf [Chionoecetes opilio]|uniref:Transmembrane GTPase Marf n=1 Tax=Chionoecetes opilio TaxID=41210 RepID=A0A8J4XX56_CHIOP|nr:Transmembrane GTPase Marf [Chionoecetes opilio]
MGTQVRDNVAGVLGSRCYRDLGPPSSPLQIFVRAKKKINDIYQEVEECPLLRDDVVLVDSPGIDVSESLDDWIDKHCLDADVFVLVANSESTLMNTEKNFFHKVSSKLSKPNIFILQNRWDMAAAEPEYLNEVGACVGGVMERAVGLRADRLKVRDDLYSKLGHTERELLELTAQMKEKIGGLVEDVERRVCNALNEEIRRLSVLVEDFAEPFHPDPLVLTLYKRTLHTHVEAGLGSNLRARLSSALAMNIESSQQEMTNRMLSLLGSERRELAATLLPRREPFEVLYRLNCENLYTQECAHDPLTPSNEPAFPTAQDDWSVISRFAVAAVGSQGTMGLALALGLMFKTVGWRLLVLTGGVYGCLYAYERLTWTNKARERTFKGQYVAHATRKLRLIVDLTSHNCSHQVQQ